MKKELTVTVLYSTRCKIGEKQKFGSFFTPLGVKKVKS